MRLHLFTPYHDEALADGSPYYYPGRAARDMMARCWAVPALWADPGDGILRPDRVEKSTLPPLYADVRVLTWDELRREAARLPLTAVCPWGWNALTVRRLREAGVAPALLPDEGRMQRLRQLSSRHTTVDLLPRIRQTVTDTIGEALIAGSEDEVWQWVSKRESAMAKAPWSCSGRGVFRLDATPSDNLRARVRGILRRQHAIELEPLYTRVMDLALEYEIHADGRVTYEGLSVFRTLSTGAYTGNLTGPQELLWQCVPREVRTTLEQVRDAYIGLIAEHIAPDYRGPLGIDLMVVRTGGDRLLRLHPCVEVNVRPTMGYAALWAGRRFAPSHTLSLFHPDATDADGICTPLSDDNIRHTN